MNKKQYERMTSFNHEKRQEQIRDREEKLLTKQKLKNMEGNRDDSELLPVEHN